MERCKNNLRYCRGGSWERGGFILSCRLSSFPSPSHLPSILGERLACIWEWGRGGFILFCRLSTSPSPSTPPLPSYCLAWKCVQYGSIGRAGMLEGRTYNGVGGGGSLSILLILQQMVRQGPEYSTLHYCTWKNFCH